MNVLDFKELFDFLIGRPTTETHLDDGHAERQEMPMGKRIALGYAQFRKTGLNVAADNRAAFAAYAVRKPANAAADRKS